MAGGEKVFRTEKYLYPEAELPQQIGQRFAHGLVVVDNRNERALEHHVIPLLLKPSSTSALGSDSLAIPVPFHAGEHRADYSRMHQTSEYATHTLVLVARRG